MGKVFRRHCFNHPDRVAAARCPTCGNLYCRECIAEHHGRVLCADCLQKAVDEPSGGRFASPVWRVVRPVLQLVFGIALTWSLFHGVGRVLMSIPSVFHEGTIWGDL